MRLRKKSSSFLGAFARRRTHLAQALKQAQIGFPLKCYARLRVLHQRLINYSCYEAFILLKREALTACKAYLNVVLQQHARNRLLVRNYFTGNKSTEPALDTKHAGRALVVVAVANQMRILNSVSALQKHKRPSQPLIKHCRQSLA